MVQVWEYSVLACRISVGLLLLASGITKVVGSREFKKALVAHDVLPVSIAPAVAISIPVVEVAAGCALLLNSWNPFTEWIACCLFISFGIFLTTSLIRGKEVVPCGCFGSLSGKVSWQLVFRNIALASVSLLGTGKMFWASVILGLPMLIIWLIRMGSNTKSLSSQPHVTGNGIA